MKEVSSNYITKGIIFILCGILIGFLPGIVNWIFYIIGGLIVAASVLLLLKSLSGGDGSLVGGSLVGVIIGAVVMLIPRILHIGIPIAAGIFFIIQGFTKIVSAVKSDDAKKPKLIFGIILLLFGGFLLGSPWRAGTIVRIIIGLVLIAIGSFYFYVAHVAKQRGDSGSNDIIDV